MRFSLMMMLLVASSCRVLAAEQVSAPRVKFEKYVLPNGLQVILHVDKKLPIVHVNQWFHVGSKNEKLGKTGFAHLFEHMMFQGSKNSPGKYLSVMEKVGANLKEGGVNGTTSEDRTNYFVTAPSGSLEYLLWLESDRLTGLLDAMTQAKLDNQRDVVKNERRQSYENVPYGRIGDLYPEYLFPPGNPYHWPVIGSMDDLTAASMDDIKDFFRTYYTPNNLTLVIAGDFEPETAKALILKYFGPVPPGPALARPGKLPFALDSDRLIVVKDRVPQPKTYLMWPGVAYFDDSEGDLDLAAEILSRGISSRLQKVLVYEKQLCSSVEASDATMEVAGNFIIEATARPGASLPEVEGIILDVIHRFAAQAPEGTTDAVEQAELDRAKNRHEYDFVTGLERIGGFGGKADQLARYNTFLGNPDMFEADMARYRRATVRSVKEAVARYLDGKKHLTVRFTPEESTRPAEANLNRAKAPELAADRAFTVPTVNTAQLANGLTVFVVENHELPKVAARVVVRGGGAYEPVAKAGLAAMTATMLDRGTTNRGAIQIEEEAGSLGSQLENGAGMESAAVAISVLKKNVAPAMELLADVVLHPVFPKEELERERAKALDDLAQSQQDPRRISRRVMNILQFGADHPYGHPIAGTEESIKAYSPADLKQFYTERYVPSNACAIFVGDITLAEAKELAEKYLGVWSGPAAAALKVPAPKPQDPTKIYVVDKQDAAQSIVTLSFPGISRSSPDYYTVNIADAVWGGNFSARLNTNLRESKGYSYGIFSGAATMSQDGYWAASGGVQTKVTRESIQEFINELKDIAGKRPIAEAELAEAKANKIRGYAQAFESLGRIAGKVGDLWVLGRPTADLAAEPEALQKVPVAEANQAAVKYLVPAKGMLLVVGDRAKIEQGLKDLKIGDLVYLDAMGKAK